ncbi:TetR/AcrR family transcriptional regulator [Iamia sp. SCSIO 61187]|nr:TetR/AcrR family transcriptional regulator [Iamia sp. SCSIO 61187]
MIDAAERLAAERGLAAMSLREVQAAAGQRNKSAAQYHFGSKEGLVEAVVAARMGAVGARRQELLDALDDRPTRRALVEALVVPLAEHVLAGPGHWARFLLQASNDPAFATVVRRTFEGASFRQVHAGLMATLDHLPEPIRARRVDHLMALVVASLAALEAGVRPDGRPALPPAVQVADLVDMAVGVLDAPASVATTAALTDRPARRA